MGDVVSLQFKSRRSMDSGVKVYSGSHTGVGLISEYPAAATSWGRTESAGSYP